MSGRGGDVKNGGGESTVSVHLTLEPQTETARAQAGHARIDHSDAPRRAVVVAAAGAFCLFALAWGVLGRSERDIAAHEGIGYALGIIGLAMMVLLLAYSVRKRVVFMRSWAPLRVWFELHMVLGLLGPTAILYHANFELGSLNSSVSLFCMLAVAGSGVVGRFIYTRIHYGVLGQRATLDELRGGVSNRRHQLSRALESCPRASQQLDRFEAIALRPSTGAFDSLQRLLLLGFRERAARRRARRLLAETLPKQVLRSCDADLREYTRAARRAAELGGYELLFSAWHALHLPLCLLLFLSAAAHVVAVHLY